MALHFPLHLAILGIGEGSQHITLARYIYSCAEKLALNTWYACVGDHLDGAQLSSNLTRSIDYFKINESAQGDEALRLVYDQIYFLGNQSGVCSPANTSNLNNGQLGVPLSFREFFKRGVSAMFQAFDLDIPQEGQVYGFQIAAHSWIVVYTYFWSAIILLFICLTASSLLADRGRSFHWNRFQWAAIGTRSFMIGFSIIALVLGLTSYSWMYNYLRSSWVLPTVVMQLCIVCLGDRVSRVRRKKQESKAFWALSDEGQETGRGGQQEPEPEPESELEHTNAYGYRSSRLF